MASRTQIKSIIIVGAGLAGLAAAIGLRKSGYYVMVLEKTSKLEDVGAGIQLPANTTRILDYIDVLPAVKRFSVWPRHLVIRSYRGHELYNQNINPEVETKYGFPHLLIHRADLRYVLHEKAIGLGVDVKFDAHVKFIHIKPTVDRPTVLLDNGKEYQADLILGADGEHSVCRESLLQRHDPPLSSGDLVFRIAIPTHRIAMDPRLNHLIEPPGVHAWYGPNSHAVTYQLRKNDIFNIVLTVADPGAATIGAQPEEMNVLLKHCQTWDPLFLGLLKLSDKVLKWTLLQTNHLDQWMHPSGKLILIGDSAHATLPYLAQGAAVAFESAYMLTMMLSHHPPTESLPSLLAAFVRSRQLRTMETRQRSKYMHDQCQLMDGPEQEERDRILGEDEPSEGFPNPWADPVYQNVLWGFDAHQEAHDIWQKWLNGDGKRWQHMMNESQMTRE